jgi:bifunctional ADP-heptose synthase (sugar kinase/adenylyltransferase)
MKAKKTPPKSIRFNIKNLEVAMQKSNAESVQELVDLMLSDYVRGEIVKVKEIKKEEKKEEQIPELSPEIKERNRINDGIYAEIEKIRLEKIPKERDKINGRKVWESEQKAKINALMVKLVL